MHILPQNWRDGRGNQTARIDGEIEEWEEAGELNRLLGHLELVTAESGHARLYAARSKGHQQQSDHREFALRNVQLLDGRDWNQGTSYRVYYGHVENRAEFAQPRVGQNSAANREEVHEDGECMVDDRGVRVVV